MVKIRLNRMGSKRNPHYRVVVVDSRKKRSSDYIELLGYYDPRHNVEVPLKIDGERAQHWLAQGAQPTDRVIKLLEQTGVEVGEVERKRAQAYTKRPRAESTTPATEQTAEA